MRETPPLLTTLLDLVFPPRCCGCRRVGRLLCDTCAQRVEPIPDPICPCCGQPQRQTQLCHSCATLDENPVTLARAVAVHATPLRETIHAFKYRKQPQLSPLLARYLCAGYTQLFVSSIRARLSAIHAIPLHPNREHTRGYNQSLLLARDLCRQMRLPLCEDALVRIRDTEPQVGKNHAERQRNVADSFRATRDLTGSTLLLIDDLYTTGATLRACAHAARDAGAVEVYALTLARARFRGR